MTVDLKELAKRVRRGVKLLDRKIPNWRAVLRKHQDQFDFADGSHCVLGTLEHYSARMALLKKQKAIMGSHPYNRAAQALGLSRFGLTRACGFDGAHGNENNATYSYREQLQDLDALWRAEFEK